MARPLRLEFTGAVYHVTARGNRRESIYESDADFSVFLEILGEVCDRYNWVIHAYCLMTNHYHLLIETPDGNLSHGMRQLNGVYTQKFNKTHGKVGHVFQGRYKAIIVDADTYLLELSRYIVLNPVRANMVDSVEQWQWSNYRAMVSNEDLPTWLHIDPLLSQFSKSRRPAIKKYISFVFEGVGQPSPLEDLKHQIYLGSDSFVEKMLSKAEDKSDLSEIPSCQRRPVAKPLQFYAENSKTRNTAIELAYSSGGYSMKQIGEFFGLHYSRVSRIVNKAKRKT